jgi:hypothetical protein
VTLHRANSEEKIGLTLCYGAAEDEVTDIFISEVGQFTTQRIILCNDVLMDAT